MCVCTQCVRPVSDKHTNNYNRYQKKTAFVQNVCKRYMSMWVPVSVCRYVRMSVCVCTYVYIYIHVIVCVCVFQRLYVA